MDVTYCLCYCVMGSTSVIIYEEKYFCLKKHPLKVIIKVRKCIWVKQLLHNIEINQK